MPHCNGDDDDFLRIFIELTVNTVIWSHYNRYINIVVPCVPSLPFSLSPFFLLSFFSTVPLTVIMHAHAGGPGRSPPSSGPASS